MDFYFAPTFILLNGLAVTGAIDLHTGGTGNATVTNATGVNLNTSSVGGNLSPLHAFVAYGKSAGSEVSFTAFLQVK